MSYFIYTVLTY